MRYALQVLLTTALALVGARCLVASGIGDFLSPGPDVVVGRFVTDMEAAPQRALDMLSDDMRRQISVLDLMTMNQALRTRYGRLSLEPGGETVRTGSRVSYHATLRTADGKVRRAEFLLGRDPTLGTWHITSLRGLRELAGGPRRSPTTHVLHQT